MSSYSDFADSASRILEHKGDVLAQGKARSGELIGSTIANLGDLIPKQVQQVMKERAAARKQQQIQAIFQQAGGDLRGAVTQLRPLDPKMALDFEKELNAADEVKAKGEELRAKHEKDLRDFQMNVLATATTPSQWASGLKGLHDLGIDISGFDQEFSDEAPQRANRLLMTPDARGKSATEQRPFVVDGALVSPTGDVLYQGEPKKPNPTEASLAMDAAGGDAAKALALLKPPPDKSLTPYQQEELTRRDKEIAVSQQRLALAIKQANKPAITKAASGLADTVIAHPELFAQLTPSEKAAIAPELDAKGFKDFKKPLSATMENRLASAKAVVQTGDDITAQLKDPKMAAMLGPAMGRYNTLREFIGAPPPELSELAGNIGSFALAQMGVHGMRNAEMAKQIEEMLSAKHTPESLAARITGINKFANHLLENEGRSAGPQVGEVKTFPNGKQGRWDGKGWELVTRGAK